MKGYNLKMDESVWKAFKIKCIENDVSIRTQLIELIKGWIGSD